MGRGIIQVSHGVLERALHLPTDHRVVGIRLVDNFSETFEICVEGPSLPEKQEGDAMQRFRYIVTVTEDRDNLVPSRTYVGEFS